MKLKFILLALSLVGLSNFVHAQSAKEQMQVVDEMVKQDASGYYAIEGLGTIKMKDGSMLDGQISLRITPNLGTQGRVQFYPEGKMTPLDFFPSQVEYFQIGTVAYYPLDVKYEMKTYTIFATMLNKNTTDKMSFYRLYIAEASSQGAPSPFYLKKSFFQKMLADKRATQLGGVSLTPFHKSMSKDVEDCPELSKKIKDKEEGYKVVMIDINNKNEDVYLQVLDEYNACK